MKPAPFAWHGPRTVAEAVATLAALAADGAHAKVLAGGQSLLPVLAMRLAEPDHLVDINAIAELDFIEVTDAGVTVGALARHAAVQRHAEANRVQPLLGQALELVAHATIRNRGTTVGSLAHADPAGEMTAVLALTAGSVTAASARGERVIDAADFFVGPLESCLEPDELAVSAFFPAAPVGSGTAFVEMARRHGDYALAGVGVVVTPRSPGAGGDGVVGAGGGGIASGVGAESGAGAGGEGAAGDPGPVSVRCALLSVSETPLVLDLSRAWADGEAAVREAVRSAIDPQDDIHASADYRGHLAEVLTVRAIRQALARTGAEAAA